MPTQPARQASAPSTRLPVTPVMLSFRRQPLRPAAATALAHLQSLADRRNDLVGAPPGDIVRCWRPDRENHVAEACRDDSGYRPPRCRRIVALQDQLNRPDKVARIPADGRAVLVQHLVTVGDELEAAMRRPRHIPDI